MIHRVKSTINLKALTNNLEIARSHAKNRKIVAVIKANAYGHGLIPAAEALQAADIYGVTDVNEADQLTAAGTDKTILILQGIIERADIARIAEAGYQVVIHSLKQISWLEDELSNITLTKPLRFWLKMNSGMGRLGIMPADFTAAYQNLQGKPWCQEVILMTHMANANLKDSELNQQQLDTFSEITKQIPEAATSIQASSALLASYGESADWVRPGIMLYGSSPFSVPHPDVDRLLPVMTFKSAVIALRDILPGETVGYAATWKAERPSRIATVAIGYGDGYPVHAPNGTPVLIKGQRCPMVGRVSMDMITVDVTDLPDVAIGDEVILWGKGLSVNEIAACAGTISYELLTRMPRRTPRVYINE